MCEGTTLYCTKPAAGHFQDVFGFQIVVRRQQVDFCFLSDARVLLSAVKFSQASDSLKT